MNARALIVVETSTGEHGQLPLRAARELGLVDVLVTSDPARYPLLGATTTTIVADTTDPAAIVQAVREAAIEPAGVLSVTDYGIDTAAHVAAILGLPGPNPAAVATARDKGLCNQVLAAADVPVARQVVVTTTEEIDSALNMIGIPCVVKPRDEAGSIGVGLALDADDARNWIEPLIRRDRNFRGRPALSGAIVEEYLLGSEVSVDVVARQGGLQVLGVTDKTIGTAPGFVEVAEAFPSMLPPTVADSAVAVARAALDAIDFTFGAAHIELKLTDRGPVIIEMNPRIAGTPLPELINLATDGDLIRDLVALHCGLPHGFDDFAVLRGAASRKPVAHGRGKVAATHGIQLAAQFPGVHHAEISVSPGDEVAPADDNTGLIGEVLATGTNSAQAAARAWAVAREIYLDLE